jgi:hypothetical protein
LKGWWFQFLPFHFLFLFRENSTRYSSFSRTQMERREFYNKVAKFYYDRNWK